jgi:indole-3-glycerol phosphate synthase
MNYILKKICTDKIKEIEVTKSKCSLDTLIKLLPEKKNKKFKNLIQESQQNKTNNIIAEIKKSSPSSGEIIKNYDPNNLAYQYEESGAGAISILTESNYFQGSIDHLSLISKTSRLPILRKDFIIDIYQIYESKVYKADAILLILTILTDHQIKEYIKIANELGLDCILETHSKDELDRAIKIDYPIIGINNRNLDNLSVDTNNVFNLIKSIPKDINIIAESGIKTYSNIQSYNEAGIYNFLIGESILKANNINKKFKELLNI